MSPELQIQLQLLSNGLAILVCIGILYSYLQQKKRLDYIEKLEKTNNEGLLSDADINFIKTNEIIFREKALKAEANIKIYNPVFILIIGIIFTFIPFSDALLKLNLIVVAYILIYLDKTNKRTCYTLFYKLKEEIKSAEGITK